MTDTGQLKNLVRVSKSLPVSPCKGLPFGKLLPLRHTHRQTTADRIGIIECLSSPWRVFIVIWVDYDRCVNKVFSKERNLE